MAKKVVKKAKLVENDMIDATGKLTAPNWATVVDLGSLNQAIQKTNARIDRIVAAISTSKNIKGM